jgi:hypothetical protein
MHVLTHTNEQKIHARVYVFIHACMHERTHRCVSSKHDHACYGKLHTNGIINDAMSCA